MKTRVVKGFGRWVVKGFGRLELALVCAVAPNMSECRGTVGAFAPAALALGLVDSRGFP
jgi:hypothetical protein